MPPPTPQPRSPTQAELEAKAREERERKEAEELAREESVLLRGAQKFVGGDRLKGHLQMSSPAEEEVAGIFTVNLRLEVEVTDSVGRLKRGFELAARGGGVTKELARQQAHERLREALAAKLQEDQ